ncbi:uncharacterized FCP1 homology domain-containing protein C1271.03c isoform X1 [Vigna angularis]|nr:uncharacterized FCP1 homology domain-containing protein C1271.03c isoform X1 [Vigna angularis]
MRTLEKNRRMDFNGNTVSTESTVVAKGKRDEENTVSATDINEDLSIEVFKISLHETEIHPLKRRLIVLDINGLLAAVVSSPPKDRKPDITIGRRAIFKRPSYLDFLEFCLEKFEVGIWSSRLKKNVDRIIDGLMPFLKNKLLFCWDLSYCTETHFKTLENKYKNVVFKDLRKLWDKHDPNLPWKKGYYNESNTLLLDDSPYKALLNPPNTSIFPHTFCYHDENDSSLAEGGELRVFLEGLTKAEDMRKYVEEHPFGQEAISKTSDSWNFYSQVIESLSAEKAMSDLKRK